MRRFFIGFWMVLLLALPVSAAGGGKIALTFDDGPSGQYTQRLLEGLRQRDVRATFFLCGYRIEAYPKLARQILQAGHEVGIHGFSHDSMCAMSRAQILAEIRKTMDLLPEDAAPVFLRPPGGACSEAVNQAAADAGLSILIWSVDPRDWATGSAGDVISHVVKHARDGDVILLHDMKDSSVDAALAIVDILKGRGFTFVTAGELAAGRQLTPGKVYRNFPTPTGPVK